MKTIFYVSARSNEVEKWDLLDCFDTYEKAQTYIESKFKEDENRHTEFNIEKVFIRDN